MHLLVHWLPYSFMIIFIMFIFIMIMIIICIVMITISKVAHCLESTGLTGEAARKAVRYSQNSSLELASSSLSSVLLGAYGISNMDVFLEKFQTAFDPPPPPHFWKFHCIFFVAKIRKYALTCVNLQ